MKLSELKPNPDNPRLIKDDKFKKLVASIKDFPKMMELRPMVVDTSMTILGGNMRYKALQEAGYTEIPDNWVKVADKLTEEEKKRFVIEDNLPFGEWNWEMMANDFDIKDLLDWGFDEENLQLDRPKPWTAENQEEFYANPKGDGVEMKSGYRLSSIWYGMTSSNDVRNYMLELPLKSGVHNGATVKLKYSRTNAEETERIIKTYMRPGDKFFEMCCGWMTFSSTAKYFGFSGTGGDIWDVSLKFCKKQIEEMPGLGDVKIIYADCRNTGEPESSYDFVHSNPPFFSLEPYGNSDNDLASLGGYELWVDAMGNMGKEAERILKPGGLANFVINDFREKGTLIPMHSDFINIILKKSNLYLHDLVVAEVISQALRFRQHDFEKKRTVKCHEYIITFKKLPSK